MLEAGLRLLHPFMPYISEEIWQSIKKEDAGETIVLAEYPKFEVEKYHQDLEEDFAYIQEVISSLRNIRAEMGISPAKEAKVIIRTEDRKSTRLNSSHANI